MLPHISYRRAFKRVVINAGKQLFIERQPVGSPVVLDPAQKQRFEELVIHPDGNAHPHPDDGPGGFVEHEFITPGLQRYF